MPGKPQSKTRRRAIEYAASRMSEFAATESSAVLSMHGRRELLRAFDQVLGGLYPHLPQKRATYGRDPVQRLRALAQRVEALSDREFHQSLAAIITELRDAHTRYLGPQSRGNEVAALPFLVERYDADDGPHFLASKVFAGKPEHAKAFEEAGFVEGVEITHWNGVPIAAAIDMHAARETGGRPDARRARATESLTLRPLRYSLPPLESWVVVTFDGAQGKGREVRLRWQSVGVADEPHATETMGSAASAYAVNHVAEAARRVKKMMFSPTVWFESAARDSRPSSTASSDGPAPANAAADFQDVVRIEAHKSDLLVDGKPFEYGYMRLWSFDLIDDDGFLAHVIARLEEIPRQGLVIDLRGNPGGLIWAAERLLQLFTPFAIEPVRFDMLATDMTRAMALAPQQRQGLSAWRASLEAAVVSGEQHSRAIPLTPPARCNDIGQRYPGPVVAVVDANTYSAGDLFAAGFIDNEIGTLIGVDEATGGGGANVWRASQVYRALAGTSQEPPVPPAGLDFTVAIRRATRVGAVAGLGIEDQGVRGHVRRPLTKRDLEEGNKDLREFCARLLRTRTPTDLRYRFDAGSLEIDTVGLDRLEVYIDERPIGAPRRVEADNAPLTFEVGERWSTIEILGFEGALRRQRRWLLPDRLD